VFDFHLKDDEIQTIERLYRHLYLDPVSDTADEWEMPFWPTLPLFNKLEGFLNRKIVPH